MGRVMARPVGVWLKSLDVPDTSLFLPGVTSAPINQGVETEMKQRANERGELVLDYEQVNSRMPTLAITFSRWSRTCVKLMLGLQTETSALTDALYMRTIRLDEARQLAAAPTGSLGNGMAADLADSEFVALVNDKEVQLTRQPFATFNAATDDTFAQGANGAIKISDNLLGLSLFGTHFFRAPITAAEVTKDAPFERFRARIHYVMPGQDIMELRYPELSIARAENSTIDFSQDPTVNFLVPNPDCKIDVRFYGRSYAC